MTDVSAPDACDSCGEVLIELQPVRRLYVSPGTRDAPGRVEVGGVERWCAVCRTHYPHHDPTDDTDP